MLNYADLKKGKRSVIAKAISSMENDQNAARKILKQIYKDTNNSTIIGITGPAGAGKSSLINKTTIALEKLGTKPAILAIDPTSHLTGGAILGDRVRMTDAADAGIFIRSIASRGATGAISHSLRNSIRVLEYSGFNPIIIESVGAGQTEVEISKIVDITVVVFNPNTGDSIQTIKAGLSEIGDIYVINKSDLAGTDKLYSAVLDYIGDSESHPTILKTSAKKNSGITTLAKTLKEMMSKKKDIDRQRLAAELKDIILNNIKEQFIDTLDSDKTFLKYLEKISSKNMTPLDAGDKITRSLLK